MPWFVYVYDNAQILPDYGLLEAEGDEDRSRENDGTTCLVSSPFEEKSDAEALRKAQAFLSKSRSMSGTQSIRVGRLTGTPGLFVPADLIGEVRR